jgi:hypothetical protein
MQAGALPLRSIRGVPRHPRGMETAALGNVNRTAAHRVADVHRNWLKDGRMTSMALRERQSACL